MRDLTGVAVRDFTGVPVRDLTGVAVRGLTGVPVRDLTGVPVRGLTGLPVRGFAWLSRAGPFDWDFIGIPGSDLWGAPVLVFAWMPVISVLPLARTLLEDLADEFFVTGNTGLETGFEVFFDSAGSRDLIPSFETTGLEGQVFTACFVTPVRTGGLVVPVFVAGLEMPVREGCLVGTVFCRDEAFGSDFGGSRRAESGREPKVPVLPVFFSIRIKLALVGLMVNFGLLIPVFTSGLGFSAADDGIELVLLDVIPERLDAVPVTFDVNRFVAGFCVDLEDEGREDTSGRDLRDAIFDSEVFEVLAELDVVGRM